MSFSETWIWTAATLSATTFLLHIFPGAKENVPPLLNSDMEPQPKFVNYYCWHLVSTTIFAMACFYALAALYPQAWELAFAATVISAAFAVLSLLIARKSDLSIWLLPQWIFFGVIATAGSIAFL